MTFEYHIYTYIIYIITSVLLTFWVGRALFKNGAVFLNDVYPNQPEFAQSVNKLLLTGFYLLNFGFIAYALKYGGSLNHVRDVFEASSKQIGKIILILGSLHFTNLIVFFNIRKKTKEARKRYLRIDNDKDAQALANET
ncbi:MAG: hypothetical protein HRT74_02765 [Flavobacteriales bacterium]|nr:hypothetical protein [Flavobacteriales bacterium]